MERMQHKTETEIPEQRRDKVAVVNKNVVDFLQNERTICGAVKAREPI